MCRQYKRLVPLDERMKLQVLLVIVAAWITTSGAAVTCSDLPTCADRLNETQNECRILKDIAGCLKKSIGDCRKQSILSEMKETLLTNFLKEYHNTCSGVSRSDAVTCADLPICLSKMGQLSEDRHEESCRILANSKDCFEEALDDCRSSSTLSKEKEDLFNLILREAERRCGPDAVTCSEADTCLLKRDSLTKKTHQELCRNLANTTECLQEALDDCRKNSTLSVETEAEIIKFRENYRKKCVLTPPRMKQMTQ